jgi:hypothetical protein
VVSRAVTIILCLQVIEWLATGTPQPCPWNEWTCEAAAAAGHIHVLEFLRQQDPPCPWSQWTTLAAAAKGQLAALQWLRARGCPWDRAECEAAGQAHSDVMRWLQRQDGGG